MLCTQSCPVVCVHSVAVGCLPLVQVAKYELASWLHPPCPQVRRDLETRPEAVNLQDEQYIRKTADRMQDVVRWLEALLASSQIVLPRNTAFCGSLVADCD